MFVAVVHFANVSQADQTTRGHLLIIGGGLLQDDSAAYERMITYAGGPSKARFGILPTESATRAGAERFTRRLAARGVPANQIDIIDLTVENAARQASNPAVSDQIRACAGLLIPGGDQRRITRALLHRSDTPGRCDGCAQRSIATARAGTVADGYSAMPLPRQVQVIRTIQTPDSSYCAEPRAASSLKSMPFVAARRTIEFQPIVFVMYHGRGDHNC
jgi:cyanophycinase-like exopeptidase